MITKRLPNSKASARIAFCKNGDEELTSGGRSEMIDVRLELHLRSHLPRITFASLKLASRATRHHQASLAHKKHDLLLKQSSLASVAFRIRDGVSHNRQLEEATTRCDSTSSDTSSRDKINDYAARL